MCVYLDSVQAVQGVNQQNDKFGLDGALILEIRELVKDHILQPSSTRDNRPTKRASTS